MADFKAAWELLLLIASGHETKRAKPGARVDRASLQIDLHGHDHEGACRPTWRNWRARQDSNLRPPA